MSAETPSALAAAEFKAIAARTGLDPAAHDMEELQEAFIRLRTLMTRLRAVEGRYAADSLAVFDPTEPL